MDLNREILQRSFDLPFHRLFRARGRPVVTPFELTFSVTHRCLNQCLTCRIPSVRADTELSEEEYRLAFDGMGFEPFAVTFTGGEPFVRDDFAGIIASACRILRPALVQVESCGDHPKNIHQAVEKVTSEFGDIQFLLWLSLDGTYDFLDHMRGGVPHSFESVLKTYQVMRTSSPANLLTGFRILLSKFNMHMGSRLVEDAFMLYPDLVSLDFAFGSETLGVTAADVVPECEALEDTVRLYLQKLGDMRGRGKQRFFNRLLAHRTGMAWRNLLAMKRRAACYAGFSSIHIDPEGKVMDCPVAARELGSLRENQFDLFRILESQPARITRKLVRAGDCFCTMSSPSISNIFLSPPGYMGLAAAAF